MRSQNITHGHCVRDVPCDTKEALTRLPRGGEGERDAVSAAAAAARESRRGWREACHHVRCSVLARVLGLGDVRVADGTLR